MISKSIAAVDIGSKYMKVLYGKKGLGGVKVKKVDMIKTPEGAVESGLIKDIDIVVESLKSSLKSKNVKPDGISFTVQGQDIVTRYIEVPVLDEKSTQQAVEWEIKQYLPDGGQGYYIAFETQDKIIDQEKKVYKTLVAAVPRDKIDKYVELSEKLNLKIEAIDTSSNSAARVFKNITKEDKEIESIGIINIGSRSSSIIILEKGKLIMEREVPFGIENLLKEIGRKAKVDRDYAKVYLFNKFDFDTTDLQSEVELRIQTLFNNVLSTFQKVVQFYSNGKTKKTLDAVYVVGGGSDIPGIENYVRTYLGSPLSVVKSSDEISEKCRIPKVCDSKFYLNAFGLLLRKE